MNHLKAQHRAYRVTEPIKVEVGPIIVPEIRRKDQAEDQGLSNDVGEEELESAVQAASQHDDTDSRLQDRTRHPKSVIDNPGFLAYRQRQPFSDRNGATPEPANSRACGFFTCYCGLLMKTLTSFTPTFNAPR